jgi:hypothetical protein
MLSHSFLIFLKHVFGIFAIVPYSVKKKLSRVTLSDCQKFFKLQHETEKLGDQVFCETVFNTVYPDPDSAIPKSIESGSWIRLQILLLRIPPFEEKFF